MRSLVLSPKFSKDGKIVNVHLNGTINVNMFLMISQSVMHETKQYALPIISGPLLACSSAISFLEIEDKGKGSDPVLTEAGLSLKGKGVSHKCRTSTHYGSVELHVKQLRSLY